MHKQKELESIIVSFLVLGWWLLSVTEYGNLLITFATLWRIWCLFASGQRL
jgi:hypothetical protein